jgi:hypothetical protein
MAVHRPENITGPFVINVEGQAEGQDLSATFTLISSSADGGDGEAPFVFKTIADAETFLGTRLSGEQLDGLEWNIIPAQEAAENRDDLNYDTKTKKFI